MNESLPHIKRQSNFELLRILAIVSVVVSHISWHGFSTPSHAYSYIDGIVNRVILQCLNIGSLGVDIFIMISGFFLIKSSKGIDLKKIMNLIAIVWFYSVMIYLILGPGISGGWSEILHAILPITYGSNWFVTVYIITYLLSPYINKSLMFCDEKEKRKKIFLILIGTMLFFWSFTHTFLMTECFASDVPLFLMLYIIGGYLRLYGQVYSTRILTTCFFVLCLIWILLPILANLSGILYVQEHITYFYAKNSLLTISISAVCVLLFSKLKITSAWINRIAKYAFPIYLISDNYWVRIWIYSDVLKCRDFSNSQILLFVILVDSLIIVFSCIVIDCMRTKILAHNVVKLTLVKKTYIYLDELSIKINKLF